MVKEKVALSFLQKEIMEEFYNMSATRVVYNKKERNDLWNKAKKRSAKLNLTKIEKECPALAHQILKSYSAGHNIQSAVFSECAYAQTLANMFELNNFTNCETNPTFLSKELMTFLGSYNLRPRYVYSNSDNSKMLIQAGGCNGIDSALITVIDLKIYTIEFKEPGAKSSEPDLPQYDESGKLCDIEVFVRQYPQFENMLRERLDLNFFDKMGNNEHCFSTDSIKTAISENYNVKKFADVLCTEDKNGVLVMLPINQIGCWANLEGEIRPAGRNHYKVWTPEFLKKYLKSNGAVIEDVAVKISEAKLSQRKARGSGAVSGFKINPLFFVYSENCTLENGDICFDLGSVRQLKPTITAKMFFKNLDYNEVKEFYFGLK